MITVHIRGGGDGGGGDHYDPVMHLVLTEGSSFVGVPQMGGWVVVDSFWWIAFGGLVDDGGG
jgi:hypothetical protein